MPWGKVALVLGVIGAAHIVFFVLLTWSAHEDVKTIERRYAAAELASATDPGPRPVDASGARRWLVEQKRWEAARTHRDRSQFVGFLGWALLASFAVQAIVLGALLHRAATRRRRSR